MTEPNTAAIRTATAYLTGHIDWQRQVWDLCDEVDRLRALADPAPAEEGVCDHGFYSAAYVRALRADRDRLASLVGTDPAETPVGLTEDERDLVEALRLGWGDSAAVESLLAIIDRLSAAPIDDRERVPEGWRVEWRVVDVTDEGDHTYTGEAVPTLGPVSPSVDPKKEP